MMKKTILTFGLISGGIMAVMMFATLPFTDSAWLQSHSMFIGYTTMVLSFMLVFFGIRSYREHWRRDHHLRARLCRRHSNHPHLIRFVRSHVGDHVFRRAQLW
jgi:hypothetical protein